MRFSALASERVAEIGPISRRLGVPEADAEDLLQDALEALWKRRGEVDPGRWPGWVRRALLNRRKEGARNWRIGKGYEAEIAYLVEQWHAEAVTPEEALSSAESRHELRSLLARLSPERREVASLYFVDEVPLTEIAERLQLPYEAVRSRWRQALEDMECARARDREKERSRSLWLAFLSSASALLLALWRRLVGRERRRDRTGALLACASLAFVLCCHDGVRPVQRTEAAFSSVFGAVASLRELLPRAELDRVEPSPSLAVATSGTNALPASGLHKGVSSAGPSASRARSVSAPAHEKGPGTDALLRLAMMTLKSDPDRAVRLLNEHARRFGPMHAATRQQLLAAIAAVRPSAIAAPVKKP
ncbi:MAG: sigma-70 family RNA polymerase sigma factor [Polyangiaceae bacterium]